MQHFQQNISFFSKEEAPYIHPRWEGAPLATRFVLSVALIDPLILTEDRIPNKVVYQTLADRQLPSA